MLCAVSAAATIAVSFSASPSPPSASEDSVFVVPPLLAPTVRFRIQVYGKYDSNTQLYYDRERPDLLLGTLDLRSYGSESGRLRAVARERFRIGAAIVRLAKGKRKDLTPLEKRVLEAYASREDRLAGAHRRIGTRTGWRDHFAKGLKRLARYQPHVEAVLRRHKLPTDLVALSMTESLFNPHALSRANAYGYWQFLRSTGMKYLHINSLLDERRDPIVSTDAAARMLIDTLRTLREWPLALTGYNCGPEKMARVAKQVGSYDLAVILQRWKPGRYMLSSRNYYASFLAALHVTKNVRTFFPTLELPPPLRFDTLPLPEETTFRAVARRCGVPVKTLAELNPALTVSARSHRRLPRGFPLRMPEGAASRCGYSSNAAPAPRLARGVGFTVMPPLGR
jgi:membrane-bound lytic murein transglycosylase D